MAKSFRELTGAPLLSASPVDSTLIIIDAQNEYAEGHLKTKQIDSTRKAISSLTEKYRSGGDGSNIVHVVHSVPEGTPVFTPNTRLAEEFEEITPQKGEKVIAKHHPGSFADTDLDEYLKKQGDKGKKIVLTGYMAHVCVSSTAREASQRGYEVVLAEDAIGDRDIPGASGEEVTKMVLTELGDAFGTVIKSSDVK